MSKKNTRTRYKLDDGTQVPGVTTVTGGQIGWNKQILINWANRIGREEGVKVRDFVDDKADIGTLSHAMVVDTLEGRDTDLEGYTAEQIDSAENSTLSFWEWYKDKNIELIFTEKELVSEKHKFGGKPDIYCKIDDKHTLIDLKSGSGIYEEHYIQVCAYHYLLAENDFAVPNSTLILNIPRSEDEKFDEQLVPEELIETYWNIFLNSLNNYYLQKEINKIKKGLKKDNKWWED